MITVAIVEDDSALRDGVATLVDAAGDMRCRHRYGSVEAALAVPAAPPPDVILLDIHLPGMLGSAGVARLCELYPRAVVLMLTVYDEQDQVFESICNGASGYLLKKTPPAKLIDAIRDAHAGGSPMSPEIARQVVTLFQRTAPTARPDQALTPQELRLVRLLADGHSYQAAARELVVSVNTVRNYIRSIYDKLHVHSKSEAVSKAIRTGLI